MTTQAQTLACSRCDKAIASTSRSLGYGLDNDDNVVCYRCCAVDDLNHMRNNGRHVLYLSLITPEAHHTRQYTDRKGQTHAAKLTNWPGSLTFDNVCISYNSTGHYTPNAGYMSRYDVWFTLDGDGYWWHGVQYGDYTQLCHVKRTKRPVTGTYRTLQAVTDGYNG